MGSIKDAALYGLLISQEKMGYHIYIDLYFTRKEDKLYLFCLTDNTVHYFMILIRNGPQIIKTQMLSTHDPLMRGSLDFPNLIKIHGISANFNINLEVYSMVMFLLCQ